MLAYGYAGISRDGQPDFSRPGTWPSGRALRRRLPHIKRRAEGQDAQRSEEHRLADAGTVICSCFRFAAGHR